MTAVAQLPEGLEDRSRAHGDGRQMKKQLGPAVPSPWDVGGRRYPGPRRRGWSKRGRAGNAAGGAAAVAVTVLLLLTAVPVGLPVPPHAVLPTGAVEVAVPLLADPTIVVVVSGLDARVTIAPIVTAVPAVTEVAAAAAAVKVIAEVTTVSAVTEAPVATAVVTVISGSRSRLGRPARSC